MSDVIQMGGGWGTAIDRMSPTLAARMAAADREYERETQRQERERAERVEAMQARAIAASVELALDRGEVVNMREAYRDGGVGRTRGEFLSYVSAQQDIEDAKLRRRTAREVEQHGLQYYEDMSADTSAPSESDKAEHQALVKARQAQYRAAGQARHRRAEARAVAQTEIARYEERQMIRRWSA